MFYSLLVVAQKQTTSREILLWMTPSEAPKALQASECSELLDPTRANYWISAQHQPGKFTKLGLPCLAHLEKKDGFCRQSAHVFIVVSMVPCIEADVAQS